MKKFTQIFRIVLLLLINSGSVTAQWTAVAPIYGGALANDGAVSFAIGGKGYIVAGSSTGAFYSYDTLANSWTPMGTVPAAMGHAFAMSFVINDKAYVVGGDTGGVPLATVWEFDPAASGNPWTQKNDFPGGVRDAGFAFAIGNTGYMGGGFDGSNIYNDVWKYNQAGDSWTPLTASLPISGLLFPTSFVIGNKGYVLTGGVAPSGVNEVANMWSIDGINDSISAKADLPGPGRQAAFAVSNNSVAIAGGGQANFTTNYYDMHMYDPVSNQWSPIADAPMLGAAWSSAFVIGNTAYAGLGAKFVGAGLTGTDIFYKYSLDISTGINKPVIENHDAALVYNSFSKQFSLKTNTSKSYIVSLYDITGKSISGDHSMIPGESFSAGSLAPGIYTARIQDERVNWTQKVIVY